MNFVKNIIFVSYLTNKGIRRICFILGLFLAFVVHIIGTNNIINLCLAFYFPFIISCLIKWVYIGFIKNDELNEKEKQKVISLTPQQKLRKKVRIKKEITKISSSVLGVFVFSIFFFGARYGINYIKNLKSLPDEEITFISGMLYRHEIAYKEVCKNYGYDLIQYPLNFKEHYKKEVSIIEKELEKKGFSLNKIYTLLQKESGEMIKATINAELEGFRKQSILDLIYEETGNYLTMDNWKDEYNEILSIKDVCIYIDNASKDIIQSNIEVDTMIKTSLKKYN